MQLPKLFSLHTKSGGPANPLCTYQEYVDWNKQYSRSTLVPSIASMAWLAWAGAVPKLDLRAIAAGHGDRMLAIAGATSGDGHPFDVASDGSRLFYKYLGIKDTFSLPGATQTLAADVAKLLAEREMNAFLPKEEDGAAVMAVFALARIMRAQWMPRIASTGSFARTWWIAKAVDIQTASMQTVTKMLGTDVPTYLKSAHAILSLAMTSNPPGRVDVSRRVSPDVVQKYGICSDDLALVANRMATTISDLQGWHASDVTALAEGYCQYAPNPLAISPLIVVDSELDPTAPAGIHYISATPGTLISSTGRVLRAASVAPKNQIGPSDLATEYGYALESYVEMVCRKTAGRDNVFRVAEWEPHHQPQADLFVADGDTGLLIEIKRSIAPARHVEVLDARGIVEVIDKIGGAWQQCENTAQRRPWEVVPRLRRIKQIAAVILVDEAIAYDGGSVSLLLNSTRKSVAPYFEAMSVDEFENMLPVLRVPGVVRLIRQKWVSGFADLPLRLFASKERQKPTRIVAGGRSYLRDEAAELQVAVGTDNDDACVARWP